MTFQYRTSKYIWVLLVIGVLGLGCSKKHPEFLSAVRSGNASVAEKILQDSPGVIHATDEYGATALNLAVDSSDHKMVSVLLKYGADVHHTSPIHGLPLSNASYYGDIAIVKLLVRSGAEIERQPDEGHHGSGTALHNAASGGNLVVVAYLIDCGADIMARDHHSGDFTPLHWAAASQRDNPTRLAVIRLLIESGADVEAVDSAGRTPRDYAVLKGYGEEYLKALEINKGLDSK